MPYIKTRFGWKKRKKRLKWNRIDRDLKFFEIEIVDFFLLRWITLEIYSKDVNRQEKHPRNDGCWHKYSSRSVHCELMKRGEKMRLAMLMNVIALRMYSIFFSSGEHRRLGYYYKIFRWIFESSLNNYRKNKRCQRCNPVFFMLVIKMSIILTLLRDLITNAFFISLYLSLSFSYFLIFSFL